MFQDFLFPKFCLGCGFLGVSICSSCEKKLRVVKKPRCFYCGKLSFLGFTHPSCKKRDGIDGCVFIFHYNDFLRKIIKTVKYRLAREILNELLNVIPPSSIEPVIWYKKYVLSLFISPIPLHSQRLKERGFNQADYIVNFLQKFLFLKRGDFLSRKKKTPPQAFLQNKKERFSNIRGAFVLKKIPSTGSILLVDDVVTSGATVREATRVLKKGGVLKVFVFALAKG